MQETRHAHKRLRQRAIKAGHLDVLMKLGERRRAPGGVDYMFLPEEVYRQEHRRLRLELEKLEATKGVRAIVAGAEVITAYRTGDGPRQLEHI